jgi:DNA-binding NtrC family response regulator
VVLLADRFMRIRGAWFDIATAEPVVVAIRPAGTRGAQFAWAERCAALARLRHTLLQPLVDYGAADDRSLFEVYAPRDTIAATPRQASYHVTHLARFLQAHGVELTADRAALLVRGLRPALQSTRIRPLGIVLQPRRALDAVVEVLSEGHRGAIRVSVCGAPGSGLRTLAYAAARQARIAGYVPVCTRALLRWAWLADRLAGRHVCLVTEPDAGPRGRAAASTLIAHLASHRPRPQVWLALSRGGGPAAIQLEPFGADTMKTMTYTDPDFGPSPGEVHEAARHAGGLPGRFLSRLSYGTFGTVEPVAFAVHEATGHYDAAPRPDSAPARSRIGSVLWRAGSRARTLELRGRHAAASRLLARAVRVLEGRGEAVQAAACCLQLGWMARDRGAIATARDHADRARRIDIRPEGGIAAACLLATCWTDEDRLIEAEGTLRGLIVAAGAIADNSLRLRCTLALARTLHWQGRYTDALALLEPMLGGGAGAALCWAWVRVARARAALGDAAGAMAAARESTRGADQLQDARLRVAASAASAEAFARVGDVDGMRAQVRAGLNICSAYHFPLAALRLRLVLLAATRVNAGHEAEAQRLRQSLQRMRKGGLPGLLARRIDVACRPEAPPEPQIVWSATVSLAQLESFLETAQRSKDDEHALGDVAAALGSQLSAAAVAVLAADGARVVATAGKPWRDRSVAAAQALASGQSVGLDPSRQPPEIAEPIKCAGEVIGAIACRWSAATSHVPMMAGTTARAAAMAVATHLRSVLDARIEPPPPSVWNDLLGESAAAVAIRDAVQRAARAPFPLLIEGESGSGKELVARAVHRLSPRHVRRFCAINCAALSDELVEAELFGHTRGAFTGATTERAGLFEEADGGTLFLDEVGELSARAQAKLLRVLQEGEVRRVGENLPRRVDVRIVAATNRRLEHEAQQGRFRTDLRFRLDVLRIVVPPLRERVGDIPILAQHFWRQAAARVGSSASLGPDALAALARHDWPGNVRELQNTIAWMAVHAPRRGRVSAAMLPARLITGPLATGSFEAAREEFERRFVRAALAQAGGQRQLAARALGVSRQGLSKMLRRLRIEPDGIA